MPFLNDTDVVDVQYDRNGRMLYHPEFHPNQGKHFTVEELIYLCKFYDYDGPKYMSLALGRTEHTICEKVYQLKKSGKFEYYKKLKLGDYRGDKKTK